MSTTIRIDRVGLRKYGEVVETTEWVLGESERTITVLGFTLDDNGDEANIEVQSRAHQKELVSHLLDLGVCFSCT